MRITLLTYGSQGDVQPFVALGLALQERGHRVRLAAPARFTTFVESHRIAFTSLAGDPVQLSEALVEEGGTNPFGATRAMMAHVIPIAGEVMAGVRAACEGTEVIVHSFLHLLDGHALASELGVPDFSAQLFPLFAGTGDFPSLAFPALPLGRSYNSLTHALYNRFYWQISRLAFYWLRNKHPAMPRQVSWPFGKRSSTPLLMAFSPAVVPRPEEWGPTVHLTGYWFLDEPSTWQPPAELAAFLEAGPPPVCVAFGSMVRRDKEQTTRAIVEGVARSGQRGVLLTGWSGPIQLELPESIMAIESAPHAWLFPQTSLVVHHGGAGTTGAALRSGVPALIVPHFGDQPFWGQRIHALGAGPPPLPSKTLSGERLAAAISQALIDPRMRQRAAELGRQLLREDGARQAAALIERLTINSAAV